MPVSSSSCFLFESEGKWKETPGPQRYERGSLCSAAVNPATPPLFPPAPQPKQHVPVLHSGELFSIPSSLTSPRTLTQATATIRLWRNEAHPSQCEGVWDEEGSLNDWPLLQWRSPSSPPLLPLFWIIQKLTCGDERHTQRLGCHSPVCLPQDASLDLPFLWLTSCTY